MERLGQFQHYLAESGLKATRQRDLIVRAFFESAGHISAEELYRLVKRRDPRIGLVTVYRTLKLLREAGLAEERQFGEGHALYEISREHHDHLICTNCGKIVEFANDTIEVLQEEVAKQYGFTILAHKHELYGLCTTCQAPARKGKAVKQAKSAQ